MLMGSVVTWEDAKSSMLGSNKMQRRRIEFVKSQSSTASLLSNRGAAKPSSSGIGVQKDRKTVVNSQVKLVITLLFTSRLSFIPIL